MRASFQISVENLAETLGGRRSGAGWIAHCPAHDDRTPSLSLRQDGERLLWHCHAGCSQEEVRTALCTRGLLPGNRESSRPPRPTSPPFPKENRVKGSFPSFEALAAFLLRNHPGTMTCYDYPPTKNGIPWGILRIDGPGGKTFRPFQRTKNGFLISDPSELLPLFHSDRIDAASPVYVVEGEKCVRTLESIGIQAVTSAHGAKSAGRSDWSVLAGRTCILWPDNDEAGTKYIRTVSAILRKQGAIIRRVDVPRLGLPPGGDAADWVPAGGTREALESLVAEDRDPDWKDDLIRTDRGKIAVNDHNLIALMDNDEEWSERLGYDQFRKELTLDKAPLSSVGITKVAARIEKKYGVGPIGDSLLARTLEVVCHKNPHHPVRDWLDPLEWDGTERIPAFFSTFFGAEDTPYTRAVAQNLFVAAVARIRCPGAKFDNMVILEGPQGIRKSTAIFALFGENWTAEMKASPENKDFDQTLQGLWCVEFAELDSFSRSDSARIKLQLSVREDYIRLPYSKRFERFPRQCVFIGTTNDDHYLKDPSGARRFWPIRCVYADVEGIRSARDQLWAEAVFRHREGATWWEVPPETKEVQDARYLDDSWSEIVGPWLQNLVPRETTTTQILEDCIGIERGRHGRSEQTRIGALMKRLGWEHVRCRTPAGRQWKYVPTSNVGTGWDKVGTALVDATGPTVPTENGSHVCAREGNTLSPHHDAHKSFNKKGWDVGTGWADQGLEPRSECPNMVQPSEKQPEVGNSDVKKEVE